MTTTPGESRRSASQLSLEGMDEPAVAAPVVDHAGDFVAEAMRTRVSERDSAHTVRSYEAALRYWAVWYALRFHENLTLPVSVAVVTQFVLDHSAQHTAVGLASELPSAVDQALVAHGVKQALGIPALATLTHKLSVLSQVHQRRHLRNPCQEGRVRDLLRRIRRANVDRGALSVSKPPLTRDPLNALLSTCDGSLRGLRDRAVMLFAWSGGGRRRSEVTAATLDTVQRQADGTWHYALGSGQPKVLAGPAAAALDAWLRASGVTDGPIFRRVRRGDRLGEPLSPAAVREIVKYRAAKAGLEGDFSAHSLRRGFLLEAVRQDVPIGEVMALSGLSSAASIVGYFRAAEAATTGVESVRRPAVSWHGPLQGGDGSRLWPAGPPEA